MVNFNKSKDINENYCAVAVQIGKLDAIPGKDRIKMANIGGRNVIVGLEWKEGDEGVFFPMKTVLDPQLLRGLNLYSKVENNADPTAKRGFFDDRGYVRMLKLGTAYSEGFLLKYSQLAEVYPEFKTSKPKIGELFDMVGDVKLAWKYEKPLSPKEHATGECPSQHWWKKSQKKLNKFDRMVPGQFAFHYDTGQLANNLHAFMPDDEITLTVKVHGTSVILANVLTKRQLSIWEKVKKLVGRKVQEVEYGVIYSTRKVIQNKYINKAEHQSFYGDGVHGAVYRDFKDYIPKGWTIYGEIVGYKEGSSTYIQKNHDYGCKPGTLKFMPYRITETFADGTVYEMPVSGVMAWTEGLKQVLEKENPEVAKKLMSMSLIYKGKAGDMYHLWPDVGVTERNWQEAVDQYIQSEQYNPEYEMPWRLQTFENFKVSTWRNQWIDAMKADKQMIGMEKKEPLCINKVPREGVVIRFVCSPDDAKAKHAYKLKSQAHYNQEMLEDDQGGSEYEG